MLLLVSATPAQLEVWRHPNVGILCSPLYIYNDDVEQWPWAADNDAFSRWDPRRYRRMLSILSERRGCLFVNAPDVVGDADETLRRFETWLPELQVAGLPISFVAQDGLRILDVPWSEIGAIFIGGTTHFKYSETVQELCAEAKERHKWLHMGRVNSVRRLLWAKSLGCDSVDGTSLSRFREDGRMQRFLIAAELPRQLPMELV